MVCIDLKPRIPQALGDKGQEKHILKDASAQGDAAQTERGLDGLTGIDDEAGNRAMKFPRDDG